MVRMHGWMGLVVAIGLIARLGGAASLAGDDVTGESGQVAWTKHAGGPGERYATDLVWDAHENRLLLFGGEQNVFRDGKFASFVMFDDLLSFDPAAGEWTTLEARGTPPSKRAYYAACWDEKRHGMWLHGGFDGTMLGELYFFDTRQNAWTEVEIHGAERPSKRDGHDLFYDAQEDRLLLFGDLESFQTMAVSQELWSFDPEARTWEKSEVDGPSARFCYCGALDAGARCLWITGGFGAGGRGTDATTWRYDLGNAKWSKHEPTPGGNHAAGRMVSIPDAGTMLLLGGGDSNRAVTLDTVTGSWKQAEAPSPMPPRSYHAMAYDPLGKRLFVHGGTRGGFFGRCVAGDLWIRTSPTAE